jgi:hypothetical protein
MSMLHSKLILASSLFSIGLFANAQATQTFVSGVGDDVNPCSRTAPCKTFAGAISKTAAGGELDVLDPGGFGSVTITKSITIDGGGVIATVLVNGPNGITIIAPAGSAVTLRNLRINGVASGVSGGGANGINFLTGAALHIENCKIIGFLENGIHIAPSTGAQVFIDDTTSQDNHEDGLNIVGSAGGSAGEVHVNISNSHFSNNAMNGVTASDGSRVSVRSSDATGNSASGFQVIATSNSATMSIADSVAANNLGAGVGAGGGGAAATIRVTNVSVFSNVTGFQTGTNGSIQSFGNNFNAGAGAPTSTIAPQ